MSAVTPPPLILTLILDRMTFATFDRLRKKHFPSECNVLPAHVTLFHSLPADREENIWLLLQETVERTPTLALAFRDVRFLGQGVAVGIDSEGLIGLRKELADAWADWLSPQDQQRYRPHVTIQNKVSAKQARELYQNLSAEWPGYQGRGEGLLLWRYLSGPWELAGEYRFAGDATGELCTC